MSIKCPKCGYVRDDELDKMTPDYECPKCGVIYAKAATKKEATATAKRNADLTAKKDNERSGFI